MVKCSFIFQILPPSIRHTPISVGLFQCATVPSPQQRAGSQRRRSRRPRGRKRSPSFGKSCGRSASKPDRRAVSPLGPPPASRRHAGCSLAGPLASWWGCTLHHNRTALVPSLSHFPVTWMLSLSDPLPTLVEDSSTAAFPLCGCLCFCSSNGVMLICVCNVHITC